MCLCYFGSRQCCCFPVVRWLDSREDYISLEMCPLIQCCLPPSFFFFFFLAFTVAQNAVLSFHLWKYVPSVNIGMFLVPWNILLMGKLCKQCCKNKRRPISLEETGFNNQPRFLGKPPPCHRPVVKTVHPCSRGGPGFCYCEL